MAMQLSPAAYGTEQHLTTPGFGVDSSSEIHQSSDEALTGHLVSSLPQWMNPVARMKSKAASK
jgi:hypothetical protein